MQAREMRLGHMQATPHGFLSVAVMIVGNRTLHGVSL